MATFNVILDFVLIAAAVWMVVAMRGLGGVIGRGLSLITIGAVILGIAHLLATLLASVVPWDGPTQSFAHRVIVLAGFLLLIIGFRQIETIKR